MYPSRYRLVRQTPVRQRHTREPHPPSWPYIPREVLFTVLPVLDRPERRNPDARFPLRIDSHDRAPRMVRTIWYNNALHGGTRNEARVTGFGGRRSPLLDPENTGAVTVFAFIPGGSGTVSQCRVWICEGEVEEDLFERRFGPLEPGRWIAWSPDAGPFPTPRPSPAAPCRLAPEDIPPAWLSAFPSGADIVAEAIRMRPDRGRSPDDRLLRRRDCEYEIFLSVEEALEMPRIRWLRDYRRVRLACADHPAAPQGASGAVAGTPCEARLPRRGPTGIQALRPRCRVRAGSPP